MRLRIRYRLVSFRFVVTAILVATVLIIKLCSYKSTNFISTWSLDGNKPNSRRIYFHGARGQTALALVRQSCAVESAARHNPGRPIHVFISTDDPDGFGLPLDYSTDPWLSTLERYPNVAVILYDEKEFFSGSPLEHWYEEGLWRNTPHGVVHLTDYWRMLSSYRGGGFYMDLDVITLKPLDEEFLWNFFSLEDEGGYNFCSGVFHLEHGHRLIESIVHSLAAKKYDPDIYSAYGPEFVKNFVIQHCDLDLPDLSSNQCKDLKVLPRDYFFPVPWTKWQVYFQETDPETMSNLLRHSYGVHVWNKFSRNHTIVKGSKELYALLAAEHCPLTFKSISN